MSRFPDFNYPLVSIVMPVYNAAQYLNDSINSILAQTYDNVELLICDDKSTDRSLEVIRSFLDSRIKVYCNSRNIGYLQTCNFLFEKASGEWIAFQDADDISHRDRIRQQMDFLLCNKNIALCGTQSVYFMKDLSRKVRQKNVATSHHSILQELHKRNQFCGASVIVSKRVLANVGWYQLYFDRIANEDYDCFFRIAHKFQVANLSETLYYVRLSSSSITRVIKTPMQYLSAEIVRFLARQREAYGYDSLTGLDPELLTDFTTERLCQFDEDKSLIHRLNADISAYNNLARNTFYASLKAVLNTPFRLINWKYFVGSIVRLMRY